jgi:HSP20 family protein
MTLMRWDPFREMASLQRAMNRLFDDQVFGQRGWGEGGDFSNTLPLDVSETEDAFIVKASIPGIDPDDLEINLHDNILTIKGESTFEDEEETQQYHLRERHFGSFMRSIALPTAIDRDEIGATCENGVLTLHLPKSQESRPRRISVNQPRTIEGQQSSSQGSEAERSNGGKKRSSGNRGRQIEGQARHSEGGDTSKRGGARTKQKNGQPQMPETDEQSSSAETMEGIERPR